MTNQLLTSALAFAEGFALIMSPCILPILPIILASSLTGSKQRPLGIICGFVITFALFSYFAHTLVLYTHINLTLIREVAYALLVVFGLTLMSNYLSERFSQLATQWTTLGQNRLRASTLRQDFFGGLWVGMLVSLLWTPCARPILASVLVQLVIQQEHWTGFFILLSFALGAAIPMLIIAWYSIKLKDSFLFFKKHALLYRRVLGLVIILNVGYMIAQELGYTYYPTVTQGGVRTTKNYLQNGLWRPYPAPAIEGINTWINSPPLTLSSLKGSVVLVDFWAYSCINCIRTIPYLNYWYQKYHDQGLEIIGVHSPEFDFEQDVENVNKAVEHDHIHYPVALDNHLITWKKYSNHFWPALYLINKEGKVVYEHFGEGADDRTENNIRFLLGQPYSTETVDVHKPTATDTPTPETYLGYDRAEANANDQLIPNQTAHYTFPKKLDKNQWALQGDWQVNPDKVTAMQANASVALHFKAKQVYVVMGNKMKQPNHLTVVLTSTGTTHQIKVENYSIYKVLSLPQFTEGLVQITTNEPGLELYTFTFGG